MYAEISIELLLKNLYSLKTHHYIAKEQTEYYISWHENISVNEVIVAGGPIRKLFFCSAE